LNKLEAFNTNQKITDYVKLIEAKINKKYLTFFGIDYWPVIRLQIAFSLIKNNQKQVSSSEKRKKFDKKLKKVKFSGFDSQLFITHKNYSININHKNYDRVLEKNIREASNPIILDLYDFSFYERNNKSYIKNFFNLISFIRVLSFIAGLLVSFLRPERVKYLNSLQLIDGITTSPVISGRRILIRIMYVHFLSKFIGYLLKKYKINSIYQAMYYDNFGLAAGLAAHKNQILNLCVQHGGQSENNPAFGNWTSIPNQGSEFLPNIFLCWDDSSASFINSWQSQTLKHKTKVIGHGWVEIYKKESTSIENYPISESIFNNKKNILITLQPSVVFDSSYINDFILNSSMTVNWILKLHPRQEGEDFVKKIESSFKSYENIIICTSKTPLPFLMAHCDVHITFFSSSIYEAIFLNKPTIIVDKRGLDYFSKYIEAGLAYYAPNNTELDRILSSELDIL
tara:strand:+ start:5056 stop:6420 length:1365 start_codon:yes stop_codon:yes gene_type:complete